MAGYTDSQYALVPLDRISLGANRWPTAIPELRPVAWAFADQADRLARQLLDGFALGRGLAPCFFLNTSSHPLSRVAFVHYPPQSTVLDGARYGVAHHTDFGMLTILCQHDVDGLQVQDADPDTLVDPVQIAPGDEAADTPIRCGDYLQWRFAKAFARRAESARTPAQ